MPKCQHCSHQATHQHILKLGSVKVNKQWVCSNCRKQIQKENNH